MKFFRSVFGRLVSRAVSAPRLKSIGLWLLRPFPTLKLRLQRIRNEARFAGSIAQRSLLENSRRPGFGAGGGVFDQAWSASRRPGGFTIEEILQRIRAELRQGDE